MTTQHTPGPWTTDEDDHDAPYQDIKIKAGNHRTVCTVWIDDAPVRDFNAEQQANARLIAAAPELLEALEKCNSALAEELAAWDIDPPLHHVLEASNACAPAITALREALEAAPQPSVVEQEQEPVAVSRDQIREVFMAHGFTIKDGQTDLKQYVYDAAYALLARCAAPQPTRLIASAPELLEALQVIAAGNTDTDVMVDIARAAIAKAEGGRL